MSVEYIPVFVENMIDGIENGAWMHEDSPMAAGIIPRAYTSDLGIFRLRVNDLHRATDIIKENGFTVRLFSLAMAQIPLSDALVKRGLALASRAPAPCRHQ